MLIFVYEIEILTRINCQLIFTTLFVKKNVDQSWHTSEIHYEKPDACQRRVPFIQGVTGTYNDLKELIIYLK